MRNTAARNLATQSSGAIALIVHEPHSVFVDDPNIGAILLGINSSLSAADYQLVSLIIDTERDSQRVTGYLGGGFVDGVIIVSARAGDPISQAIADLRLPAVMIGRPDHQSQLSWVGIDNRGAAKQITQRLARHRPKARRDDRRRPRPRQRPRPLGGFSGCLGKEVRRHPRVAPGPLHARRGSCGHGGVARVDPHLDGVFAASDAVAVGALEALASAGRRVPVDVGVVGFDDSAWARRAQPALSTIRQPAGDLGAKAAELVLEQVRSGALATDGVVLSTEVVWRESA